MEESNTNINIIRETKLNIPNIPTHNKNNKDNNTDNTDNDNTDNDNTDNTDNDEWSDDLEKLLTIIHDKSIELSTVHKEKYIKLKRTADNFKIPIIVMSSVATFFNFGLQPYLSQQTIAIICSSLTFVVTMLGTIELYLQVNKHMELEFNISKDLYINAIDIYKILNLDKEHRPAVPLHFLNERYDIFKQIIAKSDIMPDNILPVIIKSCKFRDIKLSLNKDKNKDENKDENKNENRYVNRYVNRYTDVSKV